MSNYITNPVPTDLDGLSDHIQALRNANNEFRGDLNATLEHIGFMIQKSLIISQRIVEHLRGDE